LSNDLIIHVRKLNVVEYVTHCLGLRVPQGDGIIANDFYTMLISLMKDGFPIN
jgi:hypothetical protein